MPWQVGDDGSAACCFLNVFVRAKGKGGTLFAPTAATVGLLAGLDQEGGGGPTYPPVQQVCGQWVSVLTPPSSRCVASGCLGWDGGFLGALSLALCMLYYYWQGIPEAIAAGNITQADLVTAVRRILRIKLRLGSFNDPLTVGYNAITHASVASAAHLQLAGAMVGWLLGVGG
jgi:hypothetical protein